MNVLVTPYRTIEYDEEKSLILNTWTDATADLDDDTLKDDFQRYMTEVIEECKPRLIFHDVTDFQFSIVPELQTWIDAQVNMPAIELGLERVAFVVSTDIFAQVSIEQTMEENQRQELVTQYFDNRKEAIAWLIS